MKSEQVEMLRTQQFCVKQPSDAAIAVFLAAANPPANVVCTAVTITPKDRQKATE
jgi:hypothetical protein